MALKRCPDCGEKYNDSYKYCPFCEEEEALRQGERLRRSNAAGGKRASRGGRQASYSLVTPTLVILILLMAALLVYLLFGDKIGKDDTPDSPAISTELPSASSSAPSAARKSPCMRSNSRNICAASALLPPAWAD